MTPEDCDNCDYDGFGKSVLPYAITAEIYIHENGAWYWHKLHDGRGSMEAPSHERRAVPPEKLKALRRALRKALAVVERQIAELKGGGA